MKKRYLIACYDEEECINLLKQLFLRMKIDVHNSKISKQNFLIEGPTFIIYFRSALTISNGNTDSMTFNGLVKTKKYRDFIGFEQKASYDYQYQSMKHRFGKNDADGFLQFFLRKAEHSNELFTRIS